MLCDYIKEENEIHGYSCIATNRVREIDLPCYESYEAAYKLVENYIDKIDKNEILSMYKNAVFLFKQNKFEEFINYFLRNFSSLSKLIGSNMNDEQILVSAESILELSKKYKQSDMDDISWSVK